jgi:hypothetical protein
MLQRVDDAMGWAGSAGLGADLWARVCLRYDRLVEEGRSVCGEDLGALMVSALTVESGDLDLEPACQELEDRIRRYHLDVCLEHVQGSEQARPSERLMRRCFKGWPVSPKVMVRKLMTPENRRMKGKPVHGAQEVDLAAALFDRVSRDSAVEVMMSQARTLPDAETVRARRPRRGGAGAGGPPAGGGRPAPADRGAPGGHGRVEARRPRGPGEGGAARGPGRRAPAGRRGALQAPQPGLHPPPHRGVPGGR